jgi:hypothetical protein
MTEEFDVNDEYDGIDDNVEILLEAAKEDPNQAYIYIRVKANPDEEELLVERDVSRDDHPGMSHLHTPNTDQLSVLTNGSEAQISIMFLELFEMDPIFMEAVINAIHTLQKFRNQ